MIRHLENAWLVGLLAVACATLSCTPQSSVEAPSTPSASSEPLPVAAGEAGASAGAASGGSAGAGSGSGPLSGCDCGPLMPRPPNDCPSDRWFCNRENDCSCEGAPGAAAAANVTAARRAAPDSPARAGALAEAGQGGAYGSGQGGAPGCMCTGASVSPPEGGCPLANWFCNASGLCRCRL